MARKRKKSDDTDLPAFTQLFDVYQPLVGARTGLPLFSSQVAAGFPSPADDYTEKKMDLNELIRRPASTFFLKVKGDSMIDARIHDGDLLIVDRSLQATDNKIVIGIVNGEFTVKRMKKKKGKLYLAPENDAYAAIEITAEVDFRLWGVVTYVIHKT